LTPIALITAHPSLARPAEASMPEPASPDLVHLAQEGDMAALGTLYDQHHGLIYRYLRARLGDQHTAEDLTGEVFQRMLAGLPSYRAQGLPFRAWLFRIAHNLLVDHYRRAGRGLQVEWQDSARTVDVGADPAHQVEHTLTLEHAYRALAALDDHQREVVTLRFLSGLSLRETALALGKSEDAIKALQRRGLAALRLALAGEAGERE
jgi:RNA polymerase sigma-70 factor (ECF subfamily)